MWLLKSIMAPAIFDVRNKPTDVADDENSACVGNTAFDCAKNKCKSFSSFDGKAQLHLSKEDES